jgi:septum formation protein
MDSHDPVSTVMALAFQKAHNVALRYPDQVVVGADTVVFKEMILGKPKDREDAYRMLKFLSGHWHSVYTGIAILHLDKGIKSIDVAETKVKMAKLSEADIENYLNTLEPMDKAGAYGIQGIGSVLVEGIQGEYFNVVGLPIHLLSKHLKAYFNITLL